jgi:rare lipoprotein A (peptidoglycan hydrolase)
MSMNFFGLIFAFSCLGSLLYSASLFRLPELWAGSFLVKTGANPNSFSNTTKARFNQVDRSVFQNPAGLLTHSAIGLSPIASEPISRLSSPSQGGNHKTDLTGDSIRTAAKFLPSEQISGRNLAVRIISTHTDPLIAASTDWLEQSQVPQIQVPTLAQRLYNVFGSNTTSNTASSAALLTFSSGRNFLPQKTALRISSNQGASIEVIRLWQRQRHDFLFQVWVNHTQVAEFPQQAQADSMAQKLRQILSGSSATSIRDSLQLARIDGKPSGKVGNTVLFVINQPLAKFLNRSSDLIAIDWINHLRVALSVKPLPLAEAQAQMYGLTTTKETLEGTASWYGAYFHGRLTAAGEIFNQDDLTAAHPSLPFNTFLKITNLLNGKSVIVRINDRGPYVGDRSLDLSREAAHHLGGEAVGLISYRALIMAPHKTAKASINPTSIDSTKAFGASKHQSGDRQL